ncbi:hypothetical protein ACF0H5_023303 [Mactra antiquata]
MKLENILFIGLGTVLVLCTGVLSFINDADCSHNCTLAGNWYCGPIPCPYIPCDVPNVWEKGDCCEHCPTDRQEEENHMEATVSTKNVTAHFCPYPCTMGNETVCVPPPCPPPACVDPAKHKPTDCCEYCPHGLNCKGPESSIIPYEHWKIIDGKNCTCKYPAMNADCV